MLIKQINQILFSIILVFAPVIAPLAMANPSGYTSHHETIKKADIDLEVSQVDNNKCHVISEENDCLESECECNACASVALTSVRIVTKPELIQLHNIYPDNKISDIALSVFIPPPISLRP
jgi:hypothetical protein